MLKIRNLEKTYETGDKALRDVDIEISGDEMVAIIGPSGAGKSTLVKCINRLTEPTAGSVHLDGTDLTELKKDELRAARRDIGMVHQEYNLVERLTVMENVLSGRLGYLNFWNALRRNFPDDDIAFAYETLERVGISGHEDDRADELSGGQRQRVGIARAVLQRPKILLADEPTSSLDPETSHTVLQLLSEISATENIPVLINIHEVPLAETYADRIVGLSKGQKVFEGTPTELDENAKDIIYREGESRGNQGDSRSVTVNSGRNETNHTMDG
jgi:phosphonate transport system ATP-binding protein